MLLVLVMFCTDNWGGAVHTGFMLTFVAYPQALSMCQVHIIIRCCRITTLHAELSSHQTAYFDSYHTFLSAMPVLCTNKSYMGVTRGVIVFNNFVYFKWILLWLNQIYALWLNCCCVHQNLCVKSSSWQWVYHLVHIEITVSMSRNSLEFAPQSAKNPDKTRILREKTDKTWNVKIYILFFILIQCFPSFVLLQFYNTVSISWSAFWCQNCLY